MLFLRPCKYLRLNLTTRISSSTEFFIIEPQRYFRMAVWFSMLLWKLSHWYINTTQLQQLAFPLSTLRSDHPSTTKADIYVSDPFLDPFNTPQLPHLISLPQAGCLCRDFIHVTSSTLLTHHLEIIFCDFSLQVLV